MAQKPHLVERRPTLAGRTVGRIAPRAPLYGLRKAKDPTDPSKYPPQIDEAAEVEVRAEIGVKRPGQEAYRLHIPANALDLRGAVGVQAAFAR